jgi:hypothetical protein
LTPKPQAQVWKRRKGISLVLVGAWMFRLYLVADDRHLNSPHPTPIDPEMRRRLGKIGLLCRRSRNPPTHPPPRPMRLAPGRLVLRVRRLVTPGLS